MDQVGDSNAFGDIVCLLLSVFNPDRNSSHSTGVRTSNKTGFIKSLRVLESPLVF